jgi:hypothetical protein
MISTLERLDVRVLNGADTEAKSGQSGHYYQAIRLQALRFTPSDKDKVSTLVPDPTASLRL